MTTFNFGITRNHRSADLFAAGGASCLTPASCPSRTFFLLFQHALGLSSEHLNVLLNLIAHWHSPERIPCARSSTIACRMGTSQRTVQSSLSWLVQNGFIAKMPRASMNKPQVYDLTPLVTKLDLMLWIGSS